MSSVIRQLGQAALPAHDLSRSIVFYRDVLGLPFIGSNDRMAFFQLGFTRLLIEVPETPAFDHPGSILYFDVADLEEAARELQDHGLVCDDGRPLIGELGRVAVWWPLFAIRWATCCRSAANSRAAVSRWPGG
ncbi:MAG: VOC family protein [Thermaerobacter sp.]|nr:VOC family protein [Thermaerobacter sp.]